MATPLATNAAIIEAYDLDAYLKRLHDEEWYVISVTPHRTQYWYNTQSVSRNFFYLSSGGYAPQSHQYWEQIEKLDSFSVSQYMVIARPPSTEVRSV